MTGQVIIIIILPILDAIFFPHQPPCPGRWHFYSTKHHARPIKLGFNKSRIHNLFIAIFHILSGTDVYLIQNKPATDQGHPMMMEAMEFIKSSQCMHAFPGSTQRNPSLP